MHAIEGVGLTKRYRAGGDERTVLDDVSLAVPAGAFVSIMGPSGSGKSTLLHVLGGIDRSHDGEVRIGDVALRDCDDDMLASVRREAIGFVFQAFNLVPVLSALENVALPGVISGRSGRDAERRALELLDLFGLADRAGQRPVELSGGEQQRVAIARALFQRPTVVLADEPTGNLDAEASAEVMDVLIGANRDLDQTIVLVTHDPTVAAVAGEVRVLREGTLGEPLHLSPHDQPAVRRRRVSSWVAGGASPAGAVRPRPLVAR